MIKRLLWIVAFAGACVTERESVLVDRPHVEQFILDVPDRLDNSGEGSERESVVREVDVLVFNADDRLIYRSAGFDVVDDATVSSAAARKKFSVKLRGEGVNDKVVAIVNARSALVDVPADSLLAGPTRGEVLDRLAFELPGVDVIEERGVPMWGELDRTTGNGRVEEWSVIFLTRAVARVDVRVNYLKQQHFLLESVHVYNYNRAGTIAPEVGGRTNGYNPAQWRKGEGATLQPTELAAWNGGEATEPHLPDLAALADRDSPLKVSDVPLSFSVNDASATTPADFFKRTIYLHESAAGVENDPGNVCLVIGGYRQGEVTPIHYRVDFMSSRGAYLPLLRDHRYLVDVYATEGYGTREEALASKPLDNNSVHVDVIPWDDAWDNNLIIEGELPLLLISNSAFDFDLNGGSREAYLIVNFHGWTVQEKPDWINVSPDGGGIGGIQTFTVTAEALASGSREGYFYLVSGHLKRKITITQQQ